VLVDPTGIIQNPGSFTGVGGTNTQFQLAAGAYRIKAIAAVGDTTGGNSFSKIKLRNVTDSSDTLIGVASQSNNTGGTVAVIPVTLGGIFTITATKTFELQHRASSVDTNGYGVPTNFGDNEVYVEIELEKID
jgi:hypothetical protein